MNYIGSKHKLLPFISETIAEVVGEDLSKKTFCDLFAGTGVVGRNFKTITKKVIANDVEFYSYVLNRNYIGNNQELALNENIEKLNSLKGNKGFVYKEYAQGGKSGRNYFTSENGQLIDAMRLQIQTWKNNLSINDDQYYFLLASLLESADKIANTASVYGAYLKHIKKSASKKLVLKPASFQATKNTHEVYQEDSNELIKSIKGDILYLDPPYNARQYGANYHLLNTIAKYDTFVPKGVTGLRNYYKSDYCKKNIVLNSFEELIKNAQFKFVFLSYNNEGLMSSEIVRKTMEKYGKYDLATIKYQRFKADKTESRNHKANHTTEYLHILEKTI